MQRKMVGFWGLRIFFHDIGSRNMLWVVVALTIITMIALAIYITYVMQIHKETVNSELAKAATALTEEQQVREQKDNDIIANTTKADETITKTLNLNMNNTKQNTTKIEDVQKNLTDLNKISAVMNVASTQQGPNLNISANVNANSSVNVAKGLNVTNTNKTDKLQLGDKFLLSGVGDAHANDDWLRVFDKDNKGYYGGIAANKLWAGTNMYLMGNTESHGNLNIRGGTSEHNPNGWWTHFPFVGDNKNYIRGDTEIRGNTNNIGDLNIGRNANIQGRLHFNDPTMSKLPNGSNSSDSYYLEKKVLSPNVSHLRLTMNDDNDESLQIWGGSCAAGDCANSQGTMKHRFDASGNAVHAGDLRANRLCINDICVDASQLQALKTKNGI